VAQQTQNNEAESHEQPEMSLDYFKSGNGQRQEFTP